MLTAAAVVFFAYTGFEAVANLGEETRNPRRDLPLGLLGTLRHLHAALRRRLVGRSSAWCTYSEIDEGAPIAAAFEAVGLGWAAIAGLASPRSPA